MEEINPFLVRWLSFVILKTSTPLVKSEYRKIERIKVKSLKLKCHLAFNETCVINKLLPTYTNVRLHDDAAREETFVLDFRLKLVERQIAEQKEEIINAESDFNQQLDGFRNLLQSELRYRSFLILLGRVTEKTVKGLCETQKRKIANIYGGPVPIKQTKDSVINLSSVELPNEIKEIFSLGMNCHLRQRYDHAHKKVEIEMLYENIKEKEKQKSVTIVDDACLKSDLEKFGMKKINHFHEDLLTKEQYTMVKEFNQNDSIITRKADKSNVFVILDKDYYVDQINHLLSDDTKFRKIEKDPTDELKRELNKHIGIVNTSKEVKITKREGKYEPGYIYGNPKIHKRLINPPLRPIISQIGTVTYDVSKQLNNIIRKYMPRKYTVQSTYEFITVLKDQRLNGKLASMDVESLFTNVPVLTTIDIILQNVYHHPTIPPPDFPEMIMKELLIICTTKTPFKNVNGDLYVQREGVSMGSPLGPTFADFYMCHLENNVFENNPGVKPFMYVRYVDDCFLVVCNYEILSLLKNKFESESVLKFTFEKEKDQELPFLDTLVRRCNDSFVSSVFVKETNNGDCLNFNSICPERYKTGVIKTLLHRAFHICSNWDNFHNEVERLKQLLTNNNFPISIIDKTLKQFLEKRVTNEQPSPTSSHITLYFQGQMCRNYKVEEKQLSSTINKNVKPTNEDDKLKLVVYYRTRKLRELFIRNKPAASKNKNIASRHHVVYAYSCNLEGCNASPKYIGYTTCTVDERFRMHAQNGSIKRHLVDKHGMIRVPKNDLIPSIKILGSCNTKGRLRMLEAIMIKDMKPSLNSQEEGCDRLLKIFKH